MEEKLKDVAGAKDTFKYMDYRLKTIDNDIALAKQRLCMASLFEVSAAEKRIEKLEQEKVKLEEEIGLMKAQGTI